MYKYKVGEKVWCNIGHTKGGHLPWCKGSIFRRRISWQHKEKEYSVRTMQGCFEVSEKNIKSVADVEAGTA